MKSQMKATQILLAAGLFGVLMGCGTMNSPQSRMTTPPAGPIVADTTNNSIPAGTELTIRTDENIDSNDAGRNFEAEVAQDVVDKDGRTLIPAGSSAQLVITQVNSGGDTGTKKMELALRSMKVNGKIYQVKSSTDEERAREGVGANQRTTNMIGGGAALGAAIGAITTASGVGAAAGAAIGAGAGAVAEILTRGDKVHVPAETVLKFRLNRAISVA